MGHLERPISILSDLKYRYCFHKNFKNKKKQVNIKAKIIIDISGILSTALF